MDTRPEMPQRTEYELPPQRKVSNALLVFAGLLLLAIAIGFNAWMMWRQEVQGADGPITYDARSRVEDAEMRSFRQIYDLLMQHYVTEPDSKALLEGAMEGMVEALGDPRSNYFNADQMSQQRDQSSGSYTGIGSSVQSIDDYITLINVYVDSPAEKAGLKNGDQLLAIDDVDAVGMSLDEAVSRVKGVRGTVVRLLIQRPGIAEPFEVDVVRDVVETASVAGEMLEDGIGLIQISSFTNTTGAQFGRELERLLGQGMKGLVLDLRNNGGGTLDGLMEVANMLVPKGKVFTWIFRNDIPEDMMSELEERNFELVVLMNGYSASASEVLAGALQDTGSATLVGVRSFGKGSAQYTYPLDNGGGVALTASRWLTPNGRHIEGEGLEPDIKVHDPYDPLVIEKNTAIKPGQIELLQAKLQALGFDAPFEEEIGESTVAALKAFQEQNGIYVSGVLSDDTLMVLNLLCYERIPHDSDPQMEAAMGEIRALVAQP